MKTELHTDAHGDSLAHDLIEFIAAEVSPQRDVDLTLDTDLVMSGLVDSLGVVMIVEWLERRVAITIDPGDVVIEHFDSVRAITEYLQTRDDLASSSGI